MQSSTLKELAHAIIASAETYENSYDHETSKLWQRAGKIHDYDKLYAITLYEACLMRASVIADPVYFLLSSNWNDALDWAEKNK